LSLQQISTPGAILLTLVLQNHSINNSGSLSGDAYKYTKKLLNF
jgi:hypothetical protein